MTAARRWPPRSAFAPRGGYLNERQVNQLLLPINAARVLSRAGMAYVAAHDVKAHLTRIFGFARWSSEVLSQDLVFEEQVVMGNKKPGFYVCYRSVVKLTVCAPDGTVLATYTEGHVGDNTGPTRGDVHGNALTNSESYALKRCAAMLGDQFGLGLYDKGSHKALVRGTIVRPEPEETSDKGEETPESADVQEGVEVESEGNDEGGWEKTETAGSGSGLARSAAFKSALQNRAATS